MMVENERSWIPAGVATGRPVILVSDQPWDGAGGGAVILRSLMEDAVGHGIIWATPSRTEQDLEKGRFGLRSGSLGQSGKFSWFDDMFKNAGKLAKEVDDLAQRSNASAIWLVLHGVTLRMAGHLARESSFPLHVTVNDDPIYATALRSKRQALFAPLIARDLRTSLRKAKTVDVTSRPMGEFYERKYGVKSGVLHRGLTMPPSPSPRYEVARDGLSVGILGNTYSYQQLPILGRAVALAAGRQGVRACIVVCGDGFGARFRDEMKGIVDVELTGHIPEQECITRLQRCAFVYLNYPFGRLPRVLRETSFPVKLSTYIYASRPILLHAPEGTSVQELRKDAEYCCAWSSLDPEDGASRMASMLASPAFPESHHESAESVRARYFDLATHRATLHGLLESLVAPVA